MRNLPIKVSENEIQPNHSLGGVECICELRKNATILYGIFVELARFVYHDLNGRLIGTPEVVWTPKGTDIWIDSELRWEDQHPEVRPAIYIQLSPIESTPIIPYYNGRITGADRFGTYTYNQLAKGTVNFVHVASTSGEACALADNTANFLSMAQDAIKKDFCFSRFYYTGRTPLEKSADEASPKYVSVVTFTYEYNDTWTVTPETPILKSIDIINSSRHDTINHANIMTENKVSGTPGK